MSFLSLKYHSRVRNCKCFIIAGVEVVYLPGQSLVLHGRDSMPIPRQSDPPPDGGGLLQERLRAYTFHFVSRLTAFTKVSVKHAAVPKFGSCNDSATTAIMWLY